MAAPMIRGLLILFMFVLSSIFGRIIKSEDIPTYRKRVEEMFHHAYDGYIRYAYPYDELRPLTCDGHDTWGSYSLTLIDALDMLCIVGNHSEFRRVAQLITDNMDFDQDINVSVFETNIRVVGGLLSAHLMYRRMGMDLDPGWPCSGPLLRLAEDVARRLLPAFDTPTGMPYGTVNLKHGVPKGETTITCTAGVGTFLVEFGALSRLTGDPIFEKVAMRAMKSLWQFKSPIGLVGNHIDVATGKWTALDAGVGGGVDSYFEYLVKGSVMLQNTELLEMFRAYLVSVEKYLKRDDWYMWAHMTKGSISLPLFSSLDCYWPAIQSLLGDVDSAMKTLHNFHQVWKQFGFLPEFYNIVKNEAHAGREGYPLRPELVEAAVYLYKATKDPFLLEIGVDMLESIEHNTRTKCGYATVKNVNSHMLENRMESFFLAETAKYLYLLFDPDNFIHNTGSHGTVIDTPNGQCIIDTGSYIFNTEGHPIDTAALHCCSAEKKDEDAALQHFHDNLDLLALFGISDDLDTEEGIKWTRNDKHEGNVVNLAEALLQGEHTVKLTMGDNSKSKSVKGDQRTLLSLPGHAFTENDVKNVKITIDGSKVKVEEKGLSEEEDLDKEDEQEEVNSADLSDEDSATEQEECDKDGNCKSNDEHDTHKYTFNSQIGDTPNSHTKGTSETTSPSSGRTDVSGSKAVKDVIDLIKSFTKDILSSSGLRSIKSLHEKMKYYSLFHRHKPELMTCQSQPFHMRYSILGEMFLDNS